ncbi:MAG: SIS domain-containing protein [Fibrobacterota bacterium]|nr:SIS domain-containing protein [Fibrobacterota bacterium]
MKSNLVSHYFCNLNRILGNMEATTRSGGRMGLDDAATKAIAIIEGVRTRGNKIMLVGNGGSAAIVSHIQNDFVKAAGMPAMVFNDIPLLTAFANDDGYQVAFEKMADMWAKEGDLLIAVSSSGKSQNILRAGATCLKKGCDLITMSGFSPANDLRKMGSVNFYVPSDSYGAIELAHSILGHFFTDAIADGVTPPSTGADWTGKPAEVPLMKSLNDELDALVAVKAVQAKVG